MRARWSVRRRAAIAALGCVLVMGAWAGCARDDSQPDPEEPANTAEGGALRSIPGLDPGAFDGRSGEIMAKADPLNDAEAWDSEARNADASAQLKALSKILAIPGEQDPGKLKPIIAAEFSASGVPDAGGLDEAFRDGQISVQRPVDAGDVAKPGVDASAFFRALRSPHGGARAIRVSLKIFQVTPAADPGEGFSTTALFQSSAGQIQQNAVWECGWSGESPPRLRSVRVSNYEKVRSALRFVDATGAVLGQSESFRAQMTTGAGHWKERLQKFYHIDSTAQQGIAVGDADGDGLDDIYVAQQGGLPNRLYLQNPDGTLRDVSAEAGVDWMELTHGVLFVDLDNDGDQDLVIAQSQQMLLMENKGGARFEKRYRMPAKANYFSLAAADIDLDGDLDLYACGYGPRNRVEHAEGARSHVPVPYHDSRNGGPNLLLKNDGGWAFSSATAAVGLDQNNDRHSFAASWEDFDNDGDLDLYVANDFGRNNLYRNDGIEPGGRKMFKDIAADAGVEDMSAGMGVTWGDFNRDGLMDFYVSNMFSAAGNRVTYQRQFREGADESTLSGFRRHARGNSLFQNNGDGTFADVSVGAGVTMGRWAWGAKFADLNNDGWEDLYVANGYISAEAEDDL